MTVVRSKYRPPHTSERSFAVKNLCRMLVLVAARGVETTGEVFVRQNGTPYTHDDRRTLAKTLRRHAARKRGEAPLEAKGFNRDEALYAYAKTWPTGRAYAADPTMAEMKELLRNGWFISVSGSVDDVPGRSPLDDWVSDYPHEIGLLPFPNGTGPLVVEPMRPKGAGLIRVPWSDINKFSSEFATDGRRLCIKVKGGWDTKEARTRRDLAQVVAAQERRIERIRAERNAALAEAVRLNEQLSECRDDKCDAEVEAVLDRFHELETEVRAAL